MPHLYLMTRLYNTYDKRRACELERVLLESNNNFSAYMPYRDTSEDQITGDWKQEIFSRDIQELDRCDLAIGYWDGPAFDEGIGFEIGYAIAKNKGVIILNDDFLTYNQLSKVANSRFPDPLIAALGIPVVGHIFKMTSIEGYERDLDAAINMTHTEASIQLYRELRNKERVKIKQTVPTNKVFVELGNSQILRNLIQGWAHGLEYVIARRFSCISDTATALEDAQQAINASKVYVISHGPEMSPGSSILCGLCYGYGIPFFIINDREIFPHSMTDAAMPTNLMIDVACSGYTSLLEIMQK